MAKTSEGGSKVNLSGFSNRACFSCGKMIETNKSRVIQAYSPVPGNPFRSTQQKHHYCSDCYNKLGSGK